MANGCLGIYSDGGEVGATATSTPVPTQEPIEQVSEPTTLIITWEMSIVGVIIAITAIIGFFVTYVLRGGG